jgi:hypothetical protein
LRALAIEGYPYKMTTVQVGAVQREARPFVESTDLRGDAEQLRRRAAADGYVFFRGLLGAAPIRRTRADITAILAGVGWLDAGTDPLDAISTQEAKFMGTPEFIPVYDTIQRLESLHSMGHNPALLGVAESLLGEPGMPQPSTIPRVFFPGRPEHTTTPHQDFVLVQGTPEVWTCWFPLGPCPRELGGLAVLRGSHERGVLPVFEPPGGGLTIERDALDGEWHTSPFEQGDVLFFHSKTAHQGIPNLSGDRIRLSVDYRYQTKTSTIMEKNLGVHQGRLTWEQVYAGWESEEFQYYWMDKERQSVPRIPSTEIR